MRSNSVHTEPSAVEGPATDERGQILVIVGLAMVALLAMAGLVADGGIAFANRRQAQNVADAASMGGARIIAVDRYEKVFDPSGTPTFADPGTAIQQAILDALAYNANAGQTFDPIVWGAPGAPEYTDFKGNRFPNADFPTVGPLYVEPGVPIPGEAQGVFVPASAQSNTVVMRIVGIDTMQIAVDATAVAGPGDPLGKLLPLVVRDRYKHCANSSERRTGTCDAGAVNPPIPGGPPDHQQEFTFGCQYNFREVSPAQIPCTLPDGTVINDPDPSAITAPGNFGWIDWDGGTTGNNDLRDWVIDPSTAPTEWFVDLCADNAVTQTCHIDKPTGLPIPKDDEFWRLGSATGNKQQSMDRLFDIYEKEIVYVPIWRGDQDPGNGQNAGYEIIGFGTFRVDSVQRTGNNKGFTGTFIESFVSGQAQRCTLVPQTCPGGGTAGVQPFTVNLAR